MDDISGRFSEPVPDFNFSRSRPLIAFIVDEAFFLTHIAPARKGQSAGTELRRLHLENALQLSTAVDGEEIVRRSSPRLRRRIENCLREGGLLSPKAFEEVVSIVSSLDDEAKKALAQFSTERRERIAALSQLQRAQLAEQKEAVLTAMAIASIDRHDLGVWDSGVVQSQRTQGPTSFLDGLDQARLREDSMILNDLLKLPGFSLETQNLALGSAVFQNDQAKLTLVVANRLPLEQLTGADLIYYNETFSCFLMVQYKAMEAEDDEASFRFPNAQLDAEIHRMVELRAKLQACTQCEEADGFRFSDDPFFLKFCPRIVFDPDNIALAPGMYLPGSTPFSRTVELRL